MSIDLITALLVWAGCLSAAVGAGWKMFTALADASDCCRDNMEWSCFFFWAAAGFWLAVMAASLVAFAGLSMGLLKGG